MGGGCGGGGVGGCLGGVKFFFLILGHDFRNI